ncbi:MurNAc alpha-1-phosphate uridylyltransferase [Silvimonas terrae]|uniref:MurNAc alpha-1-phosphate uridylyltransferase n=1 Tax=Silvimonas terrae TaxID=300266 RepID=A0A840RHA8_9NEIS|nr:nucleotidyltransferase family protein [Silvimonas terrae]MBB5193019.1 MurNAc alpha-1-phosphate uridylyltransferase [Silvimonas terrae]
MRAMILAAGRGERMRPLTDTCPKPLLDVGGKPLIVWHIEKLAAAGVTDLVINHAWLGQRVEETLGDGRQWGVHIRYSPESTALETAGGIAHALPLLGDAPFMVINGDIFTDYDFAQLRPVMARMAQNAECSGHLVLMPKADYPTGRDLAVDTAGYAKAAGAGDVPMTFAGIAVYTPAFFAEVPQDQPSPLLPHFLRAMTARQMTAEVFTGQWLDVGTVERLAAANDLVRSGG